VPVLVIPHRMVHDEVDDPDLVAATPGGGDDETPHA
jgi:hypothetical protein